MRQTDTVKNNKIRETFLATKAKRAEQVCRVRTVKIQENKLSATQREWLKMCFVEAKWLYNDILNRSESGEDVFSLDYTDFPEVKHFDKDKNVLVSKLTHLPAQAQQEVVKGIKSSIKTLASTKKKGGKVGKLNFISEYASINLKQANVSYKLVGGDRIRLSGCRKPFRVNGLSQLADLGEYELANAKLLCRASGYYVALTCYVKKDNEPKHEKPLMGIDLGCMTSVTCSNGKKLNATVEESGRLKTLQRKLARSQKGSSNRWKIRKQIRKEYERLDCIKDDKARKTVAALSNYRIVMQDEQLRAWKRNGHGRKVQHGILGRVKSLLINETDTVVLSQWLPTTKMCTCCGFKMELSQRDRKFVCTNCGCTEDRDVHAAQNMLWFYRNNIGVEHTDFKPADFDGAVRSAIEKLKQEAAKSLA